MSVTTITSSDSIDIEQHFRVSAGPGAGKTYWLIEHIKHILRDSTRLGKAKKVACITYTNVAVETIKSRLGTDAGRVEVSTIHSFLYRYIVKPYLPFIDPAHGLDISKVDGHDEHIPSRSKTINWIKSHPHKDRLKNPFSEKQLIRLPDNVQKLRSWLGDFGYYFDIASGAIVPYLDEKKGYQNRLNKHTVSTLLQDIRSYKSQYWQQGIIHHEDVLFFTHHLIQSHSFILDVLRARFPYFLVDEFQDTSPIQAKILSQLGLQETIIGVIGDECQSIYGFTGAEFDQHQSFSLPGIKDYEIRDNRRSTTAIISLLNTIRTSMIQNGLRGESGSKPTLHVGDTFACYQEASAQCTGQEICSLTRDNITTNALRNAVDPTSAQSGLFKEMGALDSSSDRKRWIKSLIEAIVYARTFRFKEASKAIKKLKLERQEGLHILMSLLNDFHIFENKPVIEFYNSIKKFPQSANLPTLRSGKAKTFYETNTFVQMSLCVNLVENDSLFRTIHKAKGAQFPAVFLALKKEEDLKFIHSPKLDTEEEHRINYVAVSRAQDHLFLSVPSLSPNAESKIANHLKVIRI